VLSQQLSQELPSLASVWIGIVHNLLVQITQQPRQAKQQQQQQLQKNRLLAAHTAALTAVLLSYAQSL
jgi:hypothetical protein